MKRTRELRPIREKPEYYQAIEAEMVSEFRKQLYEPLLRLTRLGTQQLTNAKEDVVEDAILREQIWYEDGGFRGRFNSRISQALKEMGAQWSLRHASWKIPEGKLGYRVYSALSTSRDRVMQMAEAINQRIHKVVPEELAEKMRFEKLFDQTIWKVSKDFDQSVKSVTVEAKLSKEQAAELAKKYSENMKLYIRNFTAKETLELRRKVQKNAFSGGRYSEIVDTIQKSYGVTQRKAKFLARQETSLLMTSFKEVRYKEAGISEYRWRCVVGSPLHPVRPYHKALDGTKQTWDNPPIVDAQGHRKHPGQDYNCRCTAIPIVRF